MSDFKNPDKGDLIIDASDVPVVDLTPEQIRKALKLRNGAEKAIDAILRLTPQQIARAGISADAIAQLGDMQEQHKRVRQLRGPCDKLAELMYETDIDCGHKISLLLGEIASQARRRAARDSNGDEILAPLDDLIAYQYGPATKAAVTREKKAKLEAQSEASPADAE